MDISRIVVARRAILGLSRRAVAEAAGISYPYISEIEKGTKDPSGATLRGLAGALRFSTVGAMYAWGEAAEALGGEWPPVPSAGARMVDVTGPAISFH